MLGYIKALENALPIKTLDGLIWKTFSQQLAEIDKLTSINSFNNSVESISFGADNYAGYSAHLIIGFDKLTNSITLDDTIEDQKTPLAIGDMVNINGGNNYEQCGLITAINGNVITLDRALPELPNPTEKELHLFVIGKPNSGPNPMDSGQIAAGLENHAISRTAVALGRKNYAYGKYSFAGGQENETAFGAVGLGRRNKVHGKFAFVGGDNNKVNGEYTAVFGQQNIVDTIGRYGLVAGFNNKLNNRFGAAIGAGLITNVTNNASTNAAECFQIVMGVYNEEVLDAAFIFGSGQHATSRKNLFVIKKDGSAEIAAMGTANNSLTTKKYVDDLITSYDNQFTTLTTTINAKTYGYTASASGFSFCIPNSSVPANTVANQAFAFGQGNTLTGGNGGAFAAGRQLKILKNDNNVVSSDSAAFGQNNEIVGAPCSGIFGQNNKIHGDGYSFTGGFLNIIEGAGKFAFAYGRGIKLNQQFQIGVGAYNAIDDDARFMVGIGTNDSKRVNGFAVKTDGTATLAAQGTTDDSVARIDGVKQLISQNIAYYSMIDEDDSWEISVLPGTYVLMAIPQDGSTPQQHAINCYTTGCTNTIMFGSTSNIVEQLGIYYNYETLTLAIESAQALKSYNFILMGSGLNKTS